MLTPNTLIHDRYLVVQQIGRGGMGAVYEAIDQRLGNHVALKQTLAGDPHLDKAFAREARLLASLQHPALPVVSDYFADSVGRFLVMQFIPRDVALAPRRAVPTSGCSALGRPATRRA
jgi:serine/threonine protein kinase